MKMQKRKQRSKIAFLQIGGEISKEKITDQKEITKDFQKWLKILEMEKRTRFE